jgi:HSP20 family molecular chaperone IbpA
MDMSEIFKTIGDDILLFFILMVILVLIVLAISQRNRYKALSVGLEKDLDKVKEQEAAIKKLENDLREYVMGGKSLREWKVVKQQVEELSELPSFIETKDEYILKIHLSMAKKDDIRVSGTNNGIKISIDSKDGPPLQSTYTTIKNIDPNGMRVTYKGNSLEVKAPKIPE